MTRKRRRFFTRKEAHDAWLRQAGICPLCGRHTPFDFVEGDHIAAWVDGGTTTTANLQALCVSCNRRKGGRSQKVALRAIRPGALRPRTVPLRRWQDEALPLVLAKITEQSVLIEACPGAGKTLFGLEVCFRLLADGKINRVLVVAPTRAIADGWASAASEADRAAPSLPLHGTAWRKTQPIGRHVGAVFTYQSLQASPDLFLAHSAEPGFRTLVVFDEVHHASVESSWGRAALDAFIHGAAAVLSLSGTPFRTDQSAMAFVPTRRGAALPLYRYAYDAAIADGACRPVQFVFAHGVAHYTDEHGAAVALTFEQQVPPREERRRLRAALHVGAGTIADLMLRRAYAHTLELREAGDLDAGLLVVCADCDHADDVASHIEAHIWDRRPVVASSRQLNPDDPEAARAIREYRSGHQVGLVAVNMVSEGVDIRRLRSVVFLTNVRTELAFRQIVGRVVRSDARNAEDYGRVFMPADREFVQMAGRIAEEVAALPPPIHIETTPPVVNSPSADSRSEITVLGSEGTGTSALVNNAAMTQEEIAAAEHFAAVMGLTTSPTTLAKDARENPGLAAAIAGANDA